MGPQILTFRGKVEYFNISWFVLNLDISSDAYDSIPRKAEKAYFKAKHEML